MMRESPARSETIGLARFADALRRGLRSVTLKGSTLTEGVPLFFARIGGVGALLLAASLSFAAGCGSTQAQGANDGGVSADDGGVTVDGGGVAPDGGPRPDGGARDGGLPPLLVPDGGCPAPTRVTTTNVPPGFLGVQRVYLSRAIDGDTAHLAYLADGGFVTQAVRFLYINTEESHGAETTDFGIETAGVVEQYLREAREIHMAVRENPSRPGQPSLDPFDRWLAIIFVDGELFESRIVREGLSAYYTKFGCAREPVHTNLLYSEAEARANRRGVWEPDHPTDYRVVLEDWIGNSTCRPNPYVNRACR
jgi:micrococcal nuclease